MRRQRNNLQQRKTLLAVLAVLSVTLAYGILLGDNGLSSYLSLRRTLVARAVEARQRITRNHDLRSRLKGIRIDDRVLEVEARARLGVVGADEIVYVFTGPPAPR